MLARKFSGQARKLASEEDSEGYKPIHRYFVYLKDKFDNYQFLNYLNQYSRDAREYLLPLLEQSMKDINTVVNVYSKQLEADVSARVGMSDYMKEEAK